jgi:pimeloyl-ACP methyl ester carboxylesterase
VELFHQFQASHRQNSVEINSATWQYFIAGHGGNPLIMLPGEEVHAEYWFRLVLAMQKKHQVVAVSLPALNSIRAYTDGLAGLIDHLEFAQIDVLGASLGGCIAQEFARRHRHRLRRLVLANSYTPDCRSPRISRIYSRINCRMPASYLRVLKKIHLYMLIALPGRELPFWRGFCEMLYDRYTARANKQALRAPVRALADFSSYRHYGPRDLLDWPGQVMIIESTNDAGSSERCRSRLKILYPQATVITLNNAGHTPGYSLPVDFSVLVGSFLQKPDCIEPGKE